MYGPGRPKPFGEATVYQLHRRLRQDQIGKLGTIRKRPVVCGIAARRAAHQEALEFPLPVLAVEQPVGQRRVRPCAAAAENTRDPGQRSVFFRRLLGARHQSHLTAHYFPTKDFFSSRCTFHLLR
jgi:hypothetical protein